MTAQRSGERAERTRSARGDAEPRAARRRRSSNVSERQGRAHHHLLRNTTYTAPSGRDGRSEERARRRPSERGAQTAASGAAEVGANIASGIGSAFGRAAEAVGGLLDRLPFPRNYVYIALGAILLAIILAIGVSTCSSPAPSEGETPAQDGQAEQASGESEGGDINADIPEELRWRDADFAVDPARVTWSTSDNGRKVAYLTIDDGPSGLTEQFLDLLDSYNCKATFFVTGQNEEYYPLIHEAYKRGHTIGLHTMTHDYDKLYASEQAFYDDLDAVGQVVKDQIGYVPCFTRFPGGSSNTQAENYSKGLMPKLVSGLQQRGYQYYDWNLDTTDGAGASADQMIEAVKGAELDTNVLILCHDAPDKEETLKALPKIIEYLQGLGYSFEALDRESWVCHHSVYQADDDGTTSADGTDAASTEDGSAVDGTSTEDSATGDEDADAAYYDDSADYDYYDDETQYTEGEGDYAEADADGEASADDAAVDEDGDYV